MTGPQLANIFLQATQSLKLQQKLFAPHLFDKLRSLSSSALRRPPRRSAAVAVASARAAATFGYSAEGGCSGWGVQWIGVVLYSKLVYNVI